MKAGPDAPKHGGRGKEMQMKEFPEAAVRRYRRESRAPEMVRILAVLHKNRQCFL